MRNSIMNPNSRSWVLTLVALLLVLVIVKVKAVDVLHEYSFVDHLLHDRDEFLHVYNLTRNSIRTLFGDEVMENGFYECLKLQNREKLYRVDIGDILLPCLGWTSQTVIKDNMYKVQVSKYNGTQYTDVGILSFPSSTKILQALVTPGLYSRYVSYLDRVILKESVYVQAVMRMWQLSAFELPLLWSMVLSRIVICISIYVTLCMVRVVFGAPATEIRSTLFSAVAWMICSFQRSFLTVMMIVSSHYSVQEAWIFACFANPSVGFLMSVVWCAFPLFPNGARTENVLTSLRAYSLLPWPTVLLAALMSLSMTVFIVRFTDQSKWTRWISIACKSFYEVILQIMVFGFFRFSEFPVASLFLGVALWGVASQFIFGMEVLGTFTGALVRQPAGFSEDGTPMAPRGNANAAMSYYQCFWPALLRGGLISYMPFGRYVAVNNEARVIAKTSDEAKDVRNFVPNTRVTPHWLQRKPENLSQSLKRAIQEKRQPSQPMINIDAYRKYLVAIYDENWAFQGTGFITRDVKFYTSTHVLGYTLDRWRNWHFVQTRANEPIELDFTKCVPTICGEYIEANLNVIQQGSPSVVGSFFVMERDKTRVKAGPSFVAGFDYNSKTVSVVCRDGAERHLSIMIFQSQGFVLSVRDDVVSHNCSTMEGFSGAPLFDVVGKIYGIHYGGSMFANVATPIWAKMNLDESNVPELQNSHESAQVDEETVEEVHDTKVESANLKVEDEVEASDANVSQEKKQETELPKQSKGKNKTVGEPKKSKEFMGVVQDPKGSKFVTSMNNWFGYVLHLAFGLLQAVQAKMEDGECKTRLIEWLEAIQVAYADRANPKVELIRKVRAMTKALDTEYEFDGFYANFEVLKEKLSQAVMYPETYADMEDRDDREEMYASDSDESEVDYSHLQTAFDKRANRERKQQSTSSTDKESIFDFLKQFQETQAKFTKDLLTSLASLKAPQVPVVVTTPPVVPVVVPTPESAVKKGRKRKGKKTVEKVVTAQDKQTPQAKVTDKSHPGFNLEMLVNALYTEKDLNDRLEYLERQGKYQSEMNFLISMAPLVQKTIWEKKVLEDMNSVCDATALIKEALVVSGKTSMRVKVVKRLNQMLAEELSKNGLKGSSGTATKDWKRTLSQKLGKISA